MGETCWRRLKAVTLGSMSTIAISSNLVWGVLENTLSVGFISCVEDSWLSTSRKLKQIPGWRASLSSHGPLALPDFLPASSIHRLSTLLNGLLSPCLFGVVPGGEAVDEYMSVSFWTLCACFYASTTPSMLMAIIITSLKSGSVCVLQVLFLKIVLAIWMPYHMNGLSC